jgi:hypothetical protein
MPLNKKIAPIQIAGLVLVGIGALLCIFYKDVTVRMAIYILFGIGAIMIFFNESFSRSSLHFHWLGVSLKLTGSLVFVVFFVIYDPIGKFFTPDYKPRSVTVSVYGNRGVSDLIKKSHGFVVMRINGSKNREPIDYQGLAKFSNLRVGDSFSLSVDDSEPYKVRKPDSMYTVGDQYEIPLEVYLEGNQRIFGYVHYKNHPLPGVRVSFQMIDTLTDSLGRFVLNIPDSLQRVGYDLNFDKNGFKSVNARAFPESAHALPVDMEKQ